MAMDRDPIDDASAASQSLEAEDYYFDGPYMVFTAAYHLKRGYCCNSGCRHCPYRDTQAGEVTSD
jgi:2-iminoacetate synthase ThiH